MNSRISAFNRLREHAYYGNFFKKFRKMDFEMCEKFMTEHAELPTDDFEKKLNRWYLDREDKPKNLNLMVELMMSANHQSHR